MTRVSTWPLVVAAVVLAAGSAAAQETTGAIIGTITSQDGVPLPGVTLQLVDPEKGLERTVVSAADGRYKLVALPPARYDLAASLDGFQTVRRTIDVELGRTVKSDIVMALGAVTAVVEVTGEAPQVDVTSTVTGMTVDAGEFMASLPVARESTQIALMAPSTVDSDRRFDNTTPGQQLVAIGGAGPAENGYQVNGLEVTNFRTMLGSTFVPMEFVEEVQVKTGGYEAEYGRATGGVINMVTKSGTNRLRGAASVYAEPKGLQSTEPDAWNRDNSVEYSESLEANGSLGGAFVRDKLFFFAFVRYVNSEYLENESYHDLGFGFNTVTENDAPYYGAKLDWNLTPSHRLEGTWISDATDLAVVQYFYDPPSQTQSGLLGTAEESRGGDNYILKYTGILTDSFLLSAQGGINQFNRTNHSDGDDCPVALDVRSGSSAYAGCWVSPDGRIVRADDEREAYRLDADWYQGDHSLRGGVDYQKNVSTNNVIWSGGEFYSYYTNGQRYEQTANGTPLSPEDWLVRRRYLRRGGTYDTFSNAVYVQDSWAVTPSLNLNLGLRWELYENRNALGETFATIDDQYGPRLGVVWDPGGQGRQKLFASLGRYHLPIASNVNYYAAGLEENRDEWHVFPADATINPDGTPSAIGELVDTNVYADGVVPDPNAVMATNLKPMSQDEVIVGGEQMVGDQWSIGARFVWREFNEVIEDLTLDEGLTAKYGVPPDFYFYIANPGSDFEGYFDIDGDGVLDPISLTADEMGYPAVDRQYYAVELTARRRFANNWMTQVAYTWSQSYGNYEGYVKSDIGQDNAGLTQDFDIPGLMDNAYGFLPNHRNHNFKAFGAYAWDFGLQVGGYLYYRSGRPRNAIGLHPTDPFAQEYGASSFFYADGTPAPRGTVGRTDDLLGLDAMVRYDLVLAGLDCWVRLDVFNLLDADAVTYFGEHSTDDTGNPDPGFGQPIYYQEPRRVRFGVGVSF